MNKEAIQKITKAYGNTIGSKPWIEAPALGTAGAITGYMGAGLVVPRLIDMMMMGKTEQEKADILREYNASDTLELAQKLMAGMGGIAGTTYGLQKHLDVRHGAEGLKDSFVEGRKYWERPEIQEDLKKRIKERQESVQYTPTRRYSSGRSFKKTASYSDGIPSTFEQSRVPISKSLDLINEDPFLTLPQKEITDIIIEGAENSSSGLTSGKALMRSAVRLGVGAATGYVFGRAASTMLALPSPVTKRLSRVGALAGGIINTGIFSEIGR